MSRINMSFGKLAGANMGFKNLRLRPSFSKVQGKEGLAFHVGDEFGAWNEPD